MIGYLFFDPFLGTFTALLLGLLFGSFGNVVVARLPVMLKRQWQQECAEALEQPVAKTPTFNLATPRSHCPSCRTTIRWYENIPVLSYLVLRGRCRHCKTRISLRYPLLEALVAVTTLFCVAFFGFSLEGWVYAIFLYVLTLLTLIDADEMLLPDQLTLPLLWAGLLASLFLDTVSPADAILGAVFGYAFLWSVYWLFRLTTGKEGMGYGDFKLLAALGAWLGWQMLPLIVLLASVIGALIGLVMILMKRHKQGVPIPFGPFLALAGAVALFVGTDIYTWYWGLLGL